jgi:hypothetical protein
MCTCFSSLKDVVLISPFLLSSGAYIVSESVHGTTRHNMVSECVEKEQVSAQAIGSKSSKNKVYPIKESALHVRKHHTL